MTAPHEHEEPMRAIARPSTVHAGDPVVIVCRPWMKHMTSSPTRAIGMLLHFHVGEAVMIVPPWSIVSPSRAIGVVTSGCRRR